MKVPIIDQGVPITINFSMSFLSGTHTSNVSVCWLLISKYSSGISVEPAVLAGCSSEVSMSAEAVSAATTLPLSAP